MNELTQERSHTDAGIVKGALALHQLGSYMNELTQERSHTNAGIVKSALGVYQLASDMKEFTQDAALLEGTSMIRRAFNYQDTIRSHLQLRVANNLVCRFFY